MSEKKILIIIPTYNEGLIIGNVVTEFKKYFFEADILVIDAYSSDNTTTEAIKNGANVIYVDQIFGISLAIETGILFAHRNNYDFLIRVDGDGQHTAIDVKELLSFALKKKIDLTIGSRFLDKSEYHPNNLRLYSIKLLRLLIKVFYKVEVTDCTSGCQILSRRLIEKLSYDEEFEYSEVGIICKTSSIKMSVAEKSINMKKRETGKSTFNLKNSFKYMFKNLLGLITSINIKFKK